MYHWDFEREHSRPPDHVPRIVGGGDRSLVRDLLPNLHTKKNFRFIPLARKDWFLNCSLNILFLRRDPPGALASHGDIDNRIKTLIDALRMPDANQLEDGMIPADDEDPFYVLMEDDELLTGLNVDTQMLLDPPAEPSDKSVKLVINVEVRPYHFTMDNLSFA